MSQPKIKKWDNVPFKTWKYEKQTEMKHKIFGYYLPLWLQILGKWDKKLNYVDGFGGLGAYHTDEDLNKKEYFSDNFGSPIISIQRILKLKEDKKIQNCKVVIIDERPDNLENIKKILEYKNISVDFVMCKSGDFDTIINQLLDDFDKNKNALAPTFFLLDPFGMKGIKLQTLKRIMKQPKAEVLLNFMYNSLQHWITHPDEKINKIYDEYFGSDVWRKCQSEKKSVKEQDLVRIFRDRCKEFCNFVYPFRFNFPNRDQTYYYLIHLSNYWVGCALMKDAVAANNDGLTEYIGQKRGLWDSIPMYKRPDKCPKCYNGKNLNYTDCCECFKKNLPKKIEYTEIMKRLIDVVPLTKRLIDIELQELEKKGELGVIPSPLRKGERRGGFKEGDIICFK